MSHIVSYMIIKLPIKALSYNGYYRSTKSGNRVKTGAGLAYDEELEYILRDYSEELEIFGKGCDPSKNIVAMEITYYNPGFMLKDGSRVSKTAGDLDNIVKVLQDKIFKVIRKDDSMVRSLKVSDMPSDFYLISVNLNIEPIPAFCPSGLSY